jgi:hypothetical protein
MGIGQSIGKGVDNIVGGVAKTVGGVANAAGKTVGGAANAAGKALGGAVRQGQRVAGGAIGGAVKGAARGMANGGVLGAIGGAQVGAMKGAGKALAGKPKSNSYNGTGGIPKEASRGKSGVSANRAERLAPKKFGDSNRSSMAPKAKAGSNYGPGKIPTAAKPNQGKFDNVAARTAGLAKQGLIKGQPSGAGVKKSAPTAPKKRAADPGNIIKKKPVSQSTAKKAPAKPAAKAPASTGGGGRPAMKMY